jgi:hypothetical protein
VQLDETGKILKESLVSGTQAVLDKAYLGYGLEDSRGSEYASLDDMIQAHVDL